MNTGREGAGDRGRLEEDWASPRLTGTGGSGYTRGTFHSGGQIAQLVEQWTENPCVIGSIPILATTFFARMRGQNSLRGAAGRLVSGTMVLTRENEA